MSLLFPMIAFAGLIPADTTVEASSEDPQRQGWTAQPDCRRGTASIIWQCLTTIFLCTYVTMHFDIPGSAPSRWIGYFHKFFCTLFALIASEVICVIAIKQFIEARATVKKAKRSGLSISLKQAYFIRAGGLGFCRKTLMAPERSSQNDVNNEMTICRPSQDSYFGKWVVEMNANNVCSNEEIDDRSKADVLAKALTSAQALWTLIQVIARYSQGLVVSLFELTTVAYIVMAAISYALWWQKPYNISRLYIVEPELVQKPRGFKFNHRDWEYAKTENEQSEPTTTNHGIINAKWNAFLKSDAPFSTTSLITPWFPFVGIVFGGIHCIAWNYAFGSSIEAWLWRISSLLTASVPLLWVLTADYIPSWLARVTRSEDFVMRLLFGLSCILYISVRLYMIVEALVSFRDSPVGIYQGLNWSTYIPHFE